MIYLLQILKLIETNELDLFEAMFELDSEEISELGYTGFEGQLINEMLDNHFNVFMEDESQLEIFTDLVINKQKAFKAGIHVEKLKRAS